jgi:hypothetical protein
LTSAVLSRTKQSTTVPKYSPSLTITLSTPQPTSPIIYLFITIAIAILTMPYLSTFISTITLFVIEYELTVLKMLLFLPIN